MSGQLLKDARESLGLTQSDLSRLCSEVGGDVSTQTISRAERGDRISKVYRQRIIDGLNAKAGQQTYRRDEIFKYE